MVKVFIDNQMVEKEEEFGKMAKEYNGLTNESIYIIIPSSFV